MEPEVKKQEEQKPEQIEVSIADVTPPPKEPVQPKAPEVSTKLWVMEITIDPEMKLSLVIQLAFVGLFKPLLEFVMIFMSYFMKHPVQLFGHTTTKKKLKVAKKEELVDTVE